MLQQNLLGRSPISMSISSELAMYLAESVFHDSQIADNYKVAVREFTG